MTNTELENIARDGANLLIKPRPYPSRPSPVKEKAKNRKDLEENLAKSKPEDEFVEVFNNNYNYRIDYTLKKILNEFKISPVVIYDYFCEKYSNINDFDHEEFKKVIEHFKSIYEERNKISSLKQIIDKEKPEGEFVEVFHSNGNYRLDYIGKKVNRTPTSVYSIINRRLIKLPKHEDGKKHNGYNLEEFKRIVEHFKNIYEKNNKKKFFKQILAEAKPEGEFVKVFYSNGKYRGGYIAKKVDQPIWIISSYVSQGLIKLPEHDKRRTGYNFDEFRIIVDYFRKINEEKKHKSWKQILAETKPEGEFVKAFHSKGNYRLDYIAKKVNRKLHSIRNAIFQGKIKLPEIEQNNNYRGYVFEEFKAIVDYYNKIGESKLVGIVKSAEQETNYHVMNIHEAEQRLRSLAAEAFGNEFLKKVFLEGLDNLMASYKLKRNGRNIFEDISDLTAKAYFSGSRNNREQLFTKEVNKIRGKIGNLQLHTGFLLWGDYQKPPENVSPYLPLKGINTKGEKLNDIIKDYLHEISKIPPWSERDYEQLEIERKECGRKLGETRKEIYKIIFDNNYPYTLLINLIEKRLKTRDLGNDKSLLNVILRYYDGIKNDNFEAKLNRLKAIKRKVSWFHTKAKQSINYDKQQQALNLLSRYISNKLAPGSLNGITRMTKTKLDELFQLQQEKEKYLKSGKDIPRELSFRIREIAYEISPDKRAEKLLDERDEININLDTIITEGNKLAVTVLKYVVGIARKIYYKNPACHYRLREDGMLFEDVIQHGNLGALISAEYYDSRKYTFTTYASYWILAQIFRGIANEANTIRIPLHITEKLIAYRKASEKAPYHTDRDSRKKIIADNMGISAEKLEDLRRYKKKPLSLDEPINENGEPLHSVILDLFEPSPLEKTITYERKERLREAANEALKKRAKDMVILYYGLDDRKSMTLEEVGEIYNVTRERVRQIIEKSLPKMKRYLEFNKIHSDADI